MATAGPRTRTVKPVTPATSRTLIEICKGDSATIYAVERLDTPVPAWRLTKTFGSGEGAGEPSHDVAFDREAGGWTCTCASQTFGARRPGFDGCKHIAALRKSARLYVPARK